MLRKKIIFVKCLLAVGLLAVLVKRELTARKKRLEAKGQKLGRGEALKLALAIQCIMFVTERFRALARLGLLPGCRNIRTAPFPTDRGMKQTSLNLQCYLAAFGLGNDAIDFDRLELRLVNPATIDLAACNPADFMAC